MYIRRGTYLHLDPRTVKESRERERQRVSTACTGPGVDVDWGTYRRKSHTSNTSNGRTNLTTFTSFIVVPHGLRG